MWSDDDGVNNLLSAGGFSGMRGLFFLHLVVVTLSPTNEPEDEKSTDLDIADPKIAARYDAIIKYWTKR